MVSFNSVTIIFKFNKHEFRFVYFMDVTWDPKDKHPSLKLEAPKIS